MRSQRSWLIVIFGGPIVDTCHRLEGTGYARVPPLWDGSVCDGFLTVTNEAAMETARRLATREGIFCGFSSGANVAAALQVASAVDPGAVVVTLVADTGLKYLSTDLFA